MANNQKFLGALVEHVPVQELSTADKQYWVQHGTELASVLLQALKRNLVAVAVTSTLLVLVRTVWLPATTEPFAAKSKFVVNTERNAPVKISYLGDNFKVWFLNGDGKTEDPIGKQTLRYHKLQESSLNVLIINELGGEAEAETTLSEMFAVMERQKHCERGALLTSGGANIFYVRDQNGALRAVGVRWYVGGWYMDAHSVEYPSAWLGGIQVFSRN